MKKKKLYAILVAALVVVLAASGFLYTRPVNVYALGDDVDPEVISISLVRSTASLADDSLQERFAYFEQGDPGYAEALASVNALRFRRSPMNIVKQFIPALASSGYTVKEIQDYAYSIYVHMGERGEDWDLYLSCWGDYWEYWDDDHKVSLPLSAEGVAADTKALGDQWWAIASPLDSYDIENKE